MITKLLAGGALVAALVLGVASSGTHQAAAAANTGSGAVTNNGTLTFNRTDSYGGTVSNAIGQLIFAGVFERYPSLQFCFAETRIGWAPFFADWMDRQIRIGRADDPRQATSERPRDSVLIKKMPTEYFRQNVTLTFEEDTWGVHLLDEPESCLADVALWGGDFPHPQGVWGPSVDEKLDEVFAGISEATKRRVLYEHAAELSGIRVPAEA